MVNVRVNVNVCVFWVHRISLDGMFLNFKEQIRLFRKVIYKVFPVINSLYKAMEDVEMRGGGMGVWDKVKKL